MIVGCSRQPRAVSVSAATVARDASGVTRVVDALVAEVPGRGPRCLPLVSGCGCAWVCAMTMHVLPDGAHEVVHDLQDSALARATVERWCFDDEGHGSPAAAARPTQRRCLDVFYDGSGCGGECIPRTDLLRCGLVGTRCAPAS